MMLRPPRATWVIGSVTGWEQLGDAVVETIVSTCVAFAYLLADLVLLIDERLRARAADRGRGAPPRPSGPSQGAAAGAQGED